MDELFETPYVVVIGDRDLEAGAFTVRNRDGEEVAGLSFATIVQRLAEENSSRALEQTIRA